VTQVLDLSPMDEALRLLDEDVSGHSAAEIMEEAGQVMQSHWRDRIADADLVLTGTYLESIAVALLSNDERGTWVQVGSNAAREDGMPYPVALEYGWEDNPATPAGLRAFNIARRRVVDGVGDAVGRKLRSRKVRQRPR
jgi:hypothetical protein